MAATLDRAQAVARGGERLELGAAGRAGLGVGADRAVARGAQGLELGAQGALGVRGAVALGRQRGLDLRHALALDHDGGLGLHAGRGVALDLLARGARGDRQLAGELGQRMVAGVAGVGAHAQLLDLPAQHGDRGQRGGLGGQAPGELLADRERIGLGVAHGGARRVALGDDVVELRPAARRARTRRRAAGARRARGRRSTTRASWSSGGNAGSIAAGR